MSKQEQLQSIIDGIRMAIPEVKGAILTSTDGLAIVHSLTNGEPNQVAAMAAAALGLGKRISGTLGLGPLNETSISGPEGNVYLYASGSSSLLALITTAGANVGLIHLEAREAASKIAEIF